MSPHLKYHIQSQQSLLNNVFRYGSEAWGALIREARAEYNRGEYAELFDDDLETLESNVAELAEVDGEQVLLEVPLYDWNREVWVIHVLDDRNEVKKVNLPRYTLPVYGHKEE